MENLPARKDEILQKADTIELHPVFVDDISCKNYKKIPFSQIATIGTAFEPMVSLFQSFACSGGSGLYQVTVPAGAHLAKFCSGKGYLGAALGNATNQVAGQAVLSPVVCNPTMFFMAAALTCIDRKLDRIQETQQEILDYLIQKDKADLEGNVRFLFDVLKNYKYNWDSVIYKSSNYTKILDIKQNAENKIIFYRGQIAGKGKKEATVYINQSAVKQLDKIRVDFESYQLALYIYAFSSFLEVFFLENYQEDYLNGIIGKMDDYACKYRDLYGECYTQIEERLQSSVETTVMKKLAGASKSVGTAIGKIPVINKGIVDEALVKTGERLGDYSGKQIMTTMQSFVDKQYSHVRPFIENIEMVRDYYNKPLEIAFDSNNLYIGLIA